MKWCLNGRQTEEYLKKADEIKIFWQEKDNLPDIVYYLEVNPQARILIFLNDEMILTDTDYQWLQQQYILCKNNMAVIIHTDIQALKCKKYNLPFIFAYPASTFLQLNRMKNMGVCDAYITDVLCHSLDIIENYYDGLQIRVIANSCGWGTMMNVWDGIEGSWFRPEDLWKLDQIDIVEFKTNTDVLPKKWTKIDLQKQEQALYRIYAERHEYEGRVNDFVYDFLNKKVLNRLLPNNFQERRSNCQLKCMKGKICHHCKSACYFAEYEVSQIMQKNYNQLKSDLE